MKVVDDPSILALVSGGGEISTATIGAEISAVGGGVGIDMWLSRVGGRRFHSLGRIRCARLYGRHVAQ